jgi:hypothetical protein
VAWEIVLLAPNQYCDMAQVSPNGAAGDLAPGSGTDVEICEEFAGAQALRRMTQNWLGRLLVCLLSGDLHPGL